jgi:tubby-related protein 1
MSRDMNKGPNSLGKVRSNFMGTEFLFYDNGLNPSKTKSQDQIRQELGAAFYESNLLGAKGPRKMKVILTPSYSLSDHSAQT